MLEWTIPSLSGWKSADAPGPQAPVRRADFSPGDQEKRVGHHGDSLQRYARGQMWPQNTCFPFIYRGSALSLPDNRIESLIQKADQVLSSLSQRADGEFCSGDSLPGTPGSPFPSSWTFSLHLSTFPPCTVKKSLTSSSCCCSLYEWWRWRGSRRAAALSFFAPSQRHDVSPFFYDCSCWCFDCEILLKCTIFSAGTRYQQQGATERLWQAEELGYETVEVTLWRVDDVVDKTSTLSFLIWQKDSRNSKTNGIIIFKMTI